MSGRGNIPVAVALLAGLAGTGVALLIDPAALLVSWLAAAATIASLAAGAMAVLAISYLVRGAWTEALHVPLVAAALTLPLAGLLFVPVLVAIPWLYPWAADAAGLAGRFKIAYLVPWFFAFRTVLYFSVWTVLALWLRRTWGDPRRMIVSATVAIMACAMAASLAGIDWLESLTPDFHSSLYGLLFLSNQLLAGLAFSVAMALARPGRGTFSAGPILFATLLLWTYNHAMQYIIVWAADIPDEVGWYAHRLERGWGVVLWGLVALQFIVPFFALLLPRVREGRRPLLMLAATTVVLRFVEMLVLAAPGTHGDTPALLLAAPAAAVTAFTAWAMIFARILAKLEAGGRDTRPLVDAFDATGSPAPRPS
jgi:hypothetical protein